MNWLFRRTTQPPTKMLLAEFRESAADARTVVTAAWQVVYIFLSAIILGLGFVAAQLLDLPREQHDWWTFGLVLAVGFVGTALASSLILINRRQAWTARITYARMRRIESLLGMAKNIYVNILDHWPPKCDDEYWQGLSPADRQLITRLHEQLPVPWLLGGTVMTWAALLPIVCWAGLALWELSIVVWK